MPLQAIIEEAAFNALPDETVIGKDSFVKNDKEGKFFLNLPDAEAGKLAFSLQGEKEALIKKRDEFKNEKTAAVQKLAAYEALGKSSEELKTFLDSNRPEEFTKYVKERDEAEKTLKESYDSTIGGQKEKIEKLEEQVRKTLANETISGLITKFGLDPDTAPANLREHIRVEPKDEGSEEHIVRVYENGVPALLAGQPKTPDQLISGWKEAKQKLTLFLAPNGGGGGASNSQGGNPTGAKSMKWSEFNSLSMGERNKFMAEGGQTVDD